MSTSESKREQLARALERIAAKADRELLPLSLQQEGPWFMSELKPLDASGNLAAAVRIEGPFSAPALLRSIETVVARHESLRTRFVREKDLPRQVIYSDVVLESAPEIDVSGLPRDQRQTEAERQLRLEAAKPFDLTRGPLIRVQLAKLDDRLHHFALTLHHIVSDSWSHGVILREVAQLYPGFLKGVPVKLAPLKHQYRDFVKAQARALATGAFDAQLDYWRMKLGGAPELSTFPPIRPRPAFQDNRSLRISTTYPREITEKLKALGREENATLFMALLSAFKILLHRHSRLDDLVVGCPFANRNDVEFEDLIGFFANVLIIRSDVSRDPTYRELLRNVRVTTLEAYEHPDLPVSRLVQGLGIPRASDHAPLFQVLFQLQNVPVPFEMPGLRITPAELNPGALAYDLFAYTEERPGGLYCFFDFLAELYDVPTMARLLKQFGVLLAAIAENPDRPISEYPLLEAAERHHLLVSLNDTKKAYRDTTLPSLFDEQAKRTPDAIALHSEKGSLTYGELHHRATGLAAMLAERGVKAGERVGICIERCPELVAALLAVMKAGGAYVPLDPSYPADRLAFMLGDSTPRVVLTQKPLDWAREFRGELLVLEPGWVPPPGTPDGFARPISPDDTAYVIYTSGSTGNPKGVMNAHRGPANRLQWMLERYPLKPVDRVLQKTPFSFDVSIWEFFWPLLSGAQLVLAKPGGQSDPGYLANLIEREGITALHMVPSMLQVFLDESGLESKCRNVRRVFCSGEALTAPQVARFFQRFENAELVNLYGPTEAAIEVTYWECKRNDPRPSIPIGYPIANARMYVLDERLEPVPVGVVGDLYIGGVPVAQGYLNRPQLTAERFLKDPHSPEPNARMYKTGDLATLGPLGEIEFLGRSDRQIKIRGMRVELDEVEATLGSHPEVKDAAVVALSDQHAGLQLVAYHVPLPNTDPTEGSLRAYLETRLPAYMVPRVMVKLPAMPLGPSGKTDRKALPAPPRHRAPVQTLATQAEKQVAAFWKEVLGVQDIGIDDDFFALGGHSLLLARLPELFEKAFGIRPPLKALYEAPTVAGMARSIVSKGSAGAADHDLPMLRADVILPGHIRARLPAKSVPDGQWRVFLTGATGFLGAFFLDELLRTQREVVCLVRASSKDEGLRRLRDNLARYRLSGDGLEHRVTVVLGGLSQPRYGLSESEFTALADRVDGILHNGAEVNLVAPYAHLRAPNVMGTLAGLELACLRRTLPFQYVSTLSVFHTPLREGRLLDEAEPLRDVAPDGGYARTKWICEQLLEEAMRRGIPTARHRIGFVTGHTQTGAWKPEDIGARMLLGSIALGLFPDVPLPINVVPADEVARAVVRLGFVAGSQGAFHLTGPHPDVEPARLVKWLTQLGRQVRLVPYAQWREALAQQPGNPLHAVLPVFEPGGPAGMRVRFSCEHTTRALSEVGVHFTEPSVTLLGKTLDFLRV